MSNQCCSIGIFSLVFCLITNNVNINAQHLTSQPQFRSPVVSTGFVSTFNGGFNTARSINAGSILQSHVQTNKDQGQDLSTLDDRSKNKPTKPVLSFVIPSYASGITHLLDLNETLPKFPIPSGELLPPIILKSQVKDVDEITSRTLLSTEPRTLPNFISTTILPTFPIADNNNYNLPNVTPISLSNKSNTETTANPVTVQPIEKLTVANFDSLFQTTTPKYESTTTAIPRILLTTKSSGPQNKINISQPNLSSTDSLRETTTLSPEAWRRLLILGEQKTPGYAIRSDGSIDSNIAFPYTTAVPTITVPSFGFEKNPILTGSPILLPVLNTAATTSSPQNAFANLNDNPFLPPLSVQSSVVNYQFSSQQSTQNGISNKNSNEPSKLGVNNLFQTTHTPLLANNVSSTSTNGEPPNPFAAFKFTFSGFQKSTTSSPIFRNQPTHAPFFAQTTNSRNVFNETKTTTKTSNPFLQGSPTVSTLNGFATNFAWNVSIAQPFKVGNGFEHSKNIFVPHNNPFLPPSVPVKSIAISNSIFKDQVNIRNENPNNPINPENSQATSSSTVNHLTSSTEKAIIDSFSSTLNPFAAFKFTFSGSQKRTTSSPILQNQQTHAPFVSQTTNSKSIFNATEITTERKDSAPTLQPNTSLLSRFATNSASNVSVPQPPKVQNKNITVPDIDPFLPPLAPINNPENIQTTSLPSANNLTSSTETSMMDSYPSTPKPFTAFNFRSSNESSNNQTFGNPIISITDRISNNNEITATTASAPTLIEKSTIQSTSQKPSTIFKLVPDSSSVKIPLNDLLPPNAPNNDLLPPLSSESSVNVVKNDKTNGLLEISNNPFLPKLDLNPFLAPFSSNLAHTVPQQISSIPSLEVSTTTTKPNVQSNFPSKFDNSALRNNFFAAPITQPNNFKYTGGFGAPPGILSPYDKTIQ